MKQTKKTVVIVDNGYLRKIGQENGKIDYHKIGPVMCDEFGLDFEQTRIHEPQPNTKDSMNGFLKWRHAVEKEDEVKVIIAGYINKTIECVEEKGVDISVALDVIEAKQDYDVILISGDGDFVPVVKKLGGNIKLVCHPASASRKLLSELPAKNILFLTKNMLEKLSL